MVWRQMTRYTVARIVRAKKESASYKTVSRHERGTRASQEDHLMLQSAKEFQNI
jgi:hypothetical protein